MFEELGNFKFPESNSSETIAPEYSDVLSYAVEKAIESLSYYGDDGGRIISNNTIGFLWKSCSDTRDRLLDLIVSKASDSYYNSRGALTTDYCRLLVESLYLHLSEQEEISDDGFEAKMGLVAIADPEYDYLAALSDAELRQNGFVATLIKRTGLTNSRDSNFFDYCFGKVKREAGAVDVKNQILTSAMANDALSDNLIKAIAKSSPISVKRHVASHLCQVIQSHKRKALQRGFVDSEKKDNENKLAQAESLIMLFASTADYEVINNLADCISKDNLPWIMPSVSSLNHYWLTKKVQQALEA